MMFWFAIYKLLIIFDVECPIIKCFDNVVAKMSINKRILSAAGYNKPKRKTENYLKIFKKHAKERKVVEKGNH